MENLARLLRNVRHRTEIRVIEVLASSETLRRGGSRIVKLPITRSGQRTPLGANPPRWFIPLSTFTVGRI
jgi:hypothetical protein